MLRHAEASIEHIAAIWKHTDTMRFYDVWRHVGACWIEEFPSSIEACWNSAEAMLKHDRFSSTRCRTVVEQLWWCSTHPENIFRNGTCLNDCETRWSNIRTDCSAILNRVLNCVEALLEQCETSLRHVETTVTRVADMLKSSAANAKHYQVNLKQHEACWNRFEAWRQQLRQSETTLIHVFEVVCREFKPSWCNVQTPWSTSQCSRIKIETHEANLKHAWSTVEAKLMQWWSSVEACLKKLWSNYEACVTQILNNAEVMLKHWLKKCETNLKQFGNSVGACVSNCGAMLKQLWRNGEAMLK